jgi:hypothetical protein
VRDSATNNERKAQQSHSQYREIAVEIAMMKFIRLAAVLALAAGAQAAFVADAPAIAGNVPVMGIEVHPTMPCAGKRC